MSASACSSTAKRKRATAAGWHSASKPPSRARRQPGKIWTSARPEAWARRDAQWVYYSLMPEGFEHARGLLGFILGVDDLSGSPPAVAKAAEPVPLNRGTFFDRRPRPHNKMLSENRVVVGGNKTRHYLRNLMTCALT